MEQEKLTKYKLVSQIKRIPLGKLEVVRSHRPYLTGDEFEHLLGGPVLIEEKLDGHPEMIELAGYIFFCEDLKYKHSIEYTSVPPPDGKDIPSFYVCYDIWIIDEERWANRSEKEILCQSIGMPVSPMVFEGEITENEIPEIAARKSAFGDQQAEGIVIKNYQAGIFGKFINIEFQKGIEDAEHWRKKPLVRNKIKTN